MESKLYTKLEAAAQERVKAYHWMNYAYVALSILGAIFIARSASMVETGTYYAHYTIDESTAIGVFMAITIPVLIFAVIFRLLINIYKQLIMNNLAKDEEYIQSLMTKD